jgi:hypothetical protein
LCCRAFFALEDLCYNEKQRFSKNVRQLPGGNRMTEAQEKRLEDLRRKRLEEIHKKRKEELARKRTSKSSKNLSMENLLDEIDLSADLTRDLADDSTIDSKLGEKKSRVRPALVIVGVVIISVLLLNFFFSRGHDLPYYLDQINPGMSYDEVLEIVPSALITKNRTKVETNNDISIFTYLVAPDIHPASYVRLGYRGIFPKNDNASIYFDDADKVVGLQFSFERGGWAPSWGSSEWDRKAKGLKE